MLNRNDKRGFGLMAIMAGLLVFAPSVRAAVLDWSTASWTSGSLVNSYDTDGDGFKEIKITITPIPSTPTPWILGAPVDDNTLPGGTGGDTLLLAVNWTVNTSTINVTIDFLNPGGAQNVSFTLTDVDRNTGGSDTGFRDYVTAIKGRLATGGTYVGPSTLTANADTLATLSGTNSTLRGENESFNGTADATIDFGTNFVNQVQFTWGNWTGSGSAPANPGQQGIGIGDISFRPRVPEVHPALAASLFCTLPMMLRWFRRRRN